MLNDYDDQKNDNIISIGYTNGMIGYIAPKNEYKYGGYEIDGFIKKFNLKSRISYEIESKYKNIRKNFSNINYSKQIEYAKTKYLSYNVKYLPKDYDISVINELLEKILSNDRKIIIDYLNKMDGNFAIIYEGKDNSYGIVDRIRSFYLL